MNKPYLLDTVATLKPVSIDRLTLVESDYTSIESLPSGIVGTIVEVYEGAEDSQYLVEARRPARARICNGYLEG